MTAVAAKPESANGAPAAAKWSGAIDSVRNKMKVSDAFVTLRDMQMDAPIEPGCLQTVEKLGEGGFATVEKAW